MKRIYSILMCSLILLSATASALTRNTSGKAPAPSTLVDAKCMVTQEQEDGYIYHMYSGATKADWNYILKLLLYTEYVPTYATVDGTNYSVYAYNIEFSTTSLILFNPEQQTLIAAFPKKPGLLTDSELAPIIAEYEKERLLPEAAKGRTIYPSFEAVTGAKITEQGFRSEKHIFDGKECRFEFYYGTYFSKVADYLAELVALGYDIKVLFHSDGSNSPLEFYFFCTKAESQLIVQFDTFVSTVYYQPDVDWFELNADEIFQLFGE